MTDTHELAHAIVHLTHELKEGREHRRHDTKLILKTLEIIMATQAELAADLRAVNAQQVKTVGEIKVLQASSDELKARIVELEGLLASGAEVTQELIDAVAAVKAQAQIVDDQIPDVVPVPVR